MPDEESPGASARAISRTVVHTAEAENIAFPALLADVLGFGAGEYVAIGHAGADSVFGSAVMSPDDAADHVDTLGAGANIWFGVCPTRGPARVKAGRGTEADATRVSALWADLDVKAGGCASVDVAEAIIANLSMIVGARPSAVVRTGHGLQPYWPIEDGHVLAGDIGPGRALLRRWGRLVDVVADKLGAGVDGVYDLSRMLRMPGTFNVKHLNGEGPLPVVAQLDPRGRPLSMAEVDERLTEHGILARDDDAAPNRVQVSPPADWIWADRTCEYAAGMIAGWARDTPAKGRNPWAYSQAIRLHCAHRFGCVTEQDYRAGRGALEARLVHLLRSTDPVREPKRFELADLWTYGQRVAAAKSDAEVRAELGGHDHHDVDDDQGATVDLVAVDAGELTTWEPVDLGPWLRGEVEPVTPSVGAYRTDGQRLLYPGLEHAIIAHTAAGKTWFALACVTAEILADHRVVYLHFEESTPASTIERLRRIGLSPGMISENLLFAAPSKPLRRGWLDPLLAARPTLVVIDGVNEAMVLLGEKIDLEGWSAVRRQAVVPFKEAGAAVLECDHLPITADPLRGDAYGTVHKGNVIDGARFALVRKDRFGRGQRGVSYLYSTKDRPGYLEVAGVSNDTASVFLGVLVVDDSPTVGADFLTLYAPKPNDGATAAAQDPARVLRAVILTELGKLPGGFVESRRRLLTHLRKAGAPARDEAVRNVLDVLVVDGELTEELGANRAMGYRLVLPPSASQTPDITGAQ